MIYRSMRAGDIAKAATLVAVLFFLACVVLHEIGHVNVFSASYREQGFCVADNGHALSFLTDAAMAALMLLCVRHGHHLSMSTPSLAPIKKNAISLLGHACGHLFLATQSTEAAGASRAFEDLSMPNRLLTFLALTAVWYGFMRDRRRSVAWTLGLATAHNGLQCFWLPSRFFFAHVLLAVLLNSAVRKLALPAAEKDIYYDMEAWLVDIPIVLMTFVEALSCDAFLMDIGGHVWFDMAVPVGFAVYYGVLLARHQPARAGNVRSIARPAFFEPTPLTRPQWGSLSLQKESNSRADERTERVAEVRRRTADGPPATAEAA